MQGKAKYLIICNCAKHGDFKPNLGEQTQIRYMHVCTYLQYSGTLRESPIPFCSTSWYNLFIIQCVCIVCVSQSVCVCVCVRERERERERD